MRLNDLIQRFKKPSLNIPVVSSISQKFADMKSTALQPFSRAGKILENIPAIASTIKFPRLPQISTPKMPNPMEVITKGFLGLKDKIPNIGFPKFPPLPDVGGFFKDKIQDVGGLFSGVVDLVGGVAGDWKARHERNKLILLGVTILFLIIGAALAFRKK